MPIFKCARCGSCCRNWINDPTVAGKFRSEFQEKWSRNKVYVLIPGTDHGLVLWEWEKERLETHAGRATLKTAPYYAIFDKNSELVLVFAWTILGDQCPLLENDRCTGYEHRPIYCRAFPLSYSQARKKIIPAGACKNNDIEENILSSFHTLEYISIEGIKPNTEFYQLYLNAKRASEIPLLIVALFIRLESEGIISRDFSMPIETIRFKIESGEYENLFRFLNIVGILPSRNHQTLWDYFMGDMEDR